jgi:hypothetical protein
MPTGLKATLLMLNDIGSSRVPTTIGCASAPAGTGARAGLPPAPVSCAVNSVAPNPYSCTVRRPSMVPSFDGDNMRLMVHAPPGGTGVVF